MTPMLQLTGCFLYLSKNFLSRVANAGLWDESPFFLRPLNPPLPKKSDQQKRPDPHRAQIS